ncbi:MAG: ABC transporter ATP-binding protein/permease [Clostridiales Family XIII bacterium]|jgi:ATP-binding cassette subfamily B protein|nr:ABC transporter ATP-binding protein/permease [Clostridiales Family XIII bacterium]
MLRLYKHIEPYAAALSLAIVLLFGQAMCDLALPDYMSDIINKGIMSGDTAYIMKTGFVMLAVSLLGVVCSVSVGYISAKIAAGLGRRLRKNIFRKVESFSNAEFDKFTTSSLITRTTNDITQIQTLMVFMIRLIFYAPIMAVGGLIHAVDTDQSMSWIIALAVGSLICLIGVMLGMALPKFKLVQTLIDRLNLVVRENLDGMLVIRAFNTQRFEENRFDRVNKDLTDVNLFINRAMSAMMPTMMLIMNLVTALIIWVGSHQVSEFHMNVGDMMAYMQYVMQIMMAFLMMSMMFIMIPRAAVSANRIADVLETEPSVANTPDGALPLRESEEKKSGQSGILEFRHVSFAYPNAKDEVLHDISFLARPGETTVFIGSTGSGKSTLVNLIPRFYDVSAGQIMLNGVDIRRTSLKELRAQLGYVPQKNILFSGTIADNLAYANKEIPEEELWRAAEIAQVKNFIEAGEDGMSSAIAQGGANVSGGQRQRLSIARALARKSQFYIFDDSFSALDFKTDAALRAALKKETGHSTVLTVTQRVSTAMKADQIIVLDHGRIVGAGKHAGLMKDCGIYREIALSQLTEEDLA